jgi:hypothetical protein
MRERRLATDAKLSWQKHSFLASAIVATLMGALVGKTWLLHVLYGLLRHGTPHARNPYIRTLGMVLLKYACYVLLRLEAVAYIK